MNLWTVFATGLFTGGLTCLAVQGGLLAATLAESEEKRLKEKVKSGNALPILAFLGAKLGAYTLFGILLGWFGSLFQLSITSQIFLQFVVVAFMVGTALNILDVHPIFRYFALQPPRFLTKLVRQQAKSNDVFAPALLGAFTVFIPCGTTQAMMALAIASGSPIKGALILFAFVLGTSPIFFLLGYFATKLGDRLQQQFMRYAAYAIIILAVFNLNNTIALTGSSFTLENIWKGIVCTISFCGDSFSSAQAVGSATNVASIAIESTGYNPNAITVKAGSQVTLNLKNNGGGGCTQAFTIPSLGIRKIVPIGSSETIVFTAPVQPGQIPFMCSMGMFRGVINVI